MTDTGTISVAINGGATASYTWKPTDTWSAVQSGLIAAINLQYGGSLTASASSYGVQLTSRQPGYATNWPVAVSVTSSNPLGTSPAESSYNATATDMAGGVTASPGASAGGSYTTFVYTPGGSKLATFTNGVAASTLQAAEIPLPGGGTAMYNSSGLNYLRHSDWLGSSRLATTWSHSVYSKTAYAPFGETYNNVGADASFTEEDNDPSTGGYSFLFRKLDPVAGRWMSPDPSGLAYADITNPQSLNLYTYVVNNPLTNFDPNGLDCVSANADGSATTYYGDCPNIDPNNEYYTDCDGCLVGDNLSGSLLNGDLEIFNGSTLVPIQGWGYTAPDAVWNGDDASVADGTTDDTLSPYAQAVFGQVAQRTAWFPDVCTVTGTVRAQIPGTPIKAGAAMDGNGKLSFSASWKQAGGSGSPEISLAGRFNADSAGIAEQVAVPIPETPLKLTFGANPFGGRNSYGLSGDLGKGISAGAAAKFGTIGDRTCNPRT